MQCVISLLVIGDFSGVAKKKCDGFTFILAGLLVQLRGFKNFSGSLKSCQKVERVRSENSAGLGSAGVSFRDVNTVFGLGARLVTATKTISV